MNKQKKRLWKMFYQDFNALKRRVADLEDEVRMVARQERAEVAASVPVYATTGDLPVAGQCGRLAAVNLDNKLYFDDGYDWQEVAFV